MPDNKVIVSSTPHIRSGDTVNKIMLHVIIALMPAAFCGVYFFGLKAALLMVVTVIWCVALESGYNRLAKKPDTIWDLSAAVTGLLLAMNLPVSAPYWVPIVGGFVAIVIVKQLFGGIGQNFMNPALAARAFLLASYPSQLTGWTAPVLNPLSYFNGVDAVSTATPLAVLKAAEGFTPQTADYLNAFLGNIGGCIGETSALALVLGGLYLLYKKVITWHSPLAYIGSAAIMLTVFGRSGFFTGNGLYELLIGGIMLGAFYMATDYSSSPITAKGQIIMGIGCGVMTAIIRTYGGYPEGVSYSILLMNLATPIIDKYVRPPVFGVKPVKKEARP